MNVLIVAPIFAPDKSVGAVRMSSLSAYLVDKGISLYVLTNKKQNVDNTIHGIVEIREIVEAKGGGLIKRRQNFGNNQKKYSLEFISWCSCTKFDVVIVSGGPFYTFQIAEEAKRLGIPCILDFRDPWILDIREFSDYFSPKKNLLKLIQLRAESSAVKAATAIVTVTETWKEKYCKHYKKFKEKFVLIENGYDDRLLKTIDLPNTENSGFTVGVFGKIFYYTKNYSMVFLSALKSYDKDLSVLQIGDREADTDKLIKKIKLSPEIIKSTGFVDYVDGIKLLNGVDAFLIIDARKGAIGTKIYDYIYLNKPIIFVGPRNTVIANMVSKFENGFVCSSEDEVINAFNEIIENKKSYLALETRPESFCRSRQNDKWLDLIEKIIKT